MPPPVLTDDDDLGPYVGQVVTLRGVVTNTKIATLCGVDVDGGPEGIVEATGRLESSTVTREEIDERIAASGQFAHRGAGTTYRLVSLDGKGLARARSGHRAIGEGQP